MKKAIREPIKSLNLSSRESLLNANAEIIQQLQDRLKAKRFRPQEGDSIKLAYVRVFVEALKTQNSILKDLELEDLKDRLEALEAMRGGSQDEEGPAYPHYDEEQDDEYTD
jgi:hypothetical protein